MEWFQIAVLALIQGITEFLPISSSAHLILPKEVLGWPDQGLAFDVAVHVGSLGAVIWYFRQDIRQLVMAWFSGLGGNTSQDSRLAWYIIWATVPAGLAGLAFNDLIEQHLRSVMVIAVTTLLFGLLLGWSDKIGGRGKQLSDISLGIALAIGIAQALALVPGTSRSGITITMALFLGLQRDAAARFSFLLSIPIIALSGGYKALELIGSDGVIWADILIGVLLSGVSAYLCIYYFLGFINRIGMMPFVYYRVVLAGLLGAVIVFY